VLADIIKECNFDMDLRCIIITGAKAGDDPKKWSFSTGADLKERRTLTQDQVRRFILRFGTPLQPWSRSAYRSSPPLMALPWWWHRTGVGLRHPDRLFQRPDGLNGNQLGHYPRRWWDARLLESLVLPKLRN